MNVFPRSQQYLSSKFYVQFVISTVKKYSYAWFFLLNCKTFNFANRSVRIVKKTIKTLNWNYERIQAFSMPLFHTVHESRESSRTFMKNCKFFNPFVTSYDSVAKQGRLMTCCWFRPESPSYCDEQLPIWKYCKKVKNQSRIN